jgi:CDP-glucose 4,6-dehydratase
MGPIAMDEALRTFEGRRVLVTGHTGFKGSWLGTILLELGAKVCGYALPPVGDRSHFDMLGLDQGLDHVVGDIRNAEALRDVVNAFRPEFVFHLAAQAIVRQSLDDPVTTFAVNIMGSANLLDAVGRCESVRSLVVITSDKCYENREWVWGYRETDRLGGRDPYSASKAAAELVFSAYDRSFFQDRAGLGAATARAGNVIGGGDWAPDRIIPDCVRAVENGEPVRLRHPEATRPWQHVLEPLSGYLLLGASLFHYPEHFGGSWNFGPLAQDVRTVADVAERVVRELGKGGVDLSGVDRDHREATLLQLNCDKAGQLLGWSARWDVDHTLARTAEWYREVVAGGSARDATLRQIREYFPELL